MMEGLLLAFAVLVFLAFWRPFRRIAMWFLGFGFVGYLVLGGAIDQDPENGSRDMALVIFGVPWALLFMIGFIQAMWTQSSAERAYR